MLNQIPIYLLMLILLMNSSIYFNDFSFKKGLMHMSVLFRILCCCFPDNQNEKNERIIIKQNKQPKFQENKKRQQKYSLSSQRSQIKKQKRQELLRKKSLSIKVKGNSSISQQNSSKIQQNRTQKYQNQQFYNCHYKVLRKHHINQLQQEIDRNKSNGLIIKLQSLISQENKKKQEKIPQRYPQKSTRIMINERFDNFWQQQSKFKQDLFPIDQNVYEEGLPNMGNTCYLNSLIQLLFAAERFTTTIQKISLSNPNSFHQRLSQLFQSIKQHSTSLKKKIILSAVIKDITEYQSQFMPHEQNDSLECLLTIINMLENENSSSSKMSFFRLRYSLTCKCKNNEDVINEAIYVSSRQTCFNCQEYFGIIIHSSVIYILLVPDQGLKQYICFNNVKGEQLIYQCKAFVSYFGDRSSGHYIAHRKQKNKSWICLNDSKVNVSQNIEKLGYTPKYCLYQFYEKRMYKPPLKN